MRTIATLVAVADSVSPQRQHTSRQQAETTYVAACCIAEYDNCSGRCLLAQAALNDHGRAGADSPGADDMQLPEVDINSMRVTTTGKLRLQGRAL